jgi:DNA-binding CsgD family transcriptional regulator
VARARALSARDVAALQRAILELYSHRDLESFRAAVPGIFMKLIPAAHFSLADVRLDLERRSIQFLDLWESHPVSVGGIHEAMRRNIFDHPFTRHGMKHGMARALRLSDFVTLTQLRKMRIYREAFQPARIGRLLSIGAFGGPGTATLSLTRPERARDFSERDRWLLELLRPHFDQARLHLEHEAKLRAKRSRRLQAKGMTPREIEVALWLARGKTNSEIAGILLSTPRTVEKHVERILQKMGVANRATAAVAMAGILREEPSRRGTRGRVAGRASRG